MKIIKQPDSKYVFPYIAYLPEDLSAHPGLIIHLHGIGERGDGQDDLDRVLVNGLPTIANDGNLKDAILVMPQCPSDAFWVTKAESVRQFIDNICELYSVDNKRIYLCGLSMGGFGTWYIAAAYPDLFAAIAPCCGGGMPWKADLLKMPVWAFHGMDDATVSVRYTQEMIAALDGRNPNFHYTLYEGVGHDAWVKAFSPELLHWLLMQHK